MTRPSPSRTLARFALAAALLAPLGAGAHFLELIPATEIVTRESANPLQLDLRFTHPMERGPIMEMDEPVRFGVQGPGGQEDLKGSLKADRTDGKRTWSASYRIRRPGDYVFFVEPSPYWEPAEGKLIVHYAKVVVDAFGAGEGWDAELGLPVEIVPLARPYGLWTGNLFQGIVKRDGQPVPFAAVEVEWRNDGSVTPPATPYVTQAVRADANGLFSYAMPRAGWWGFAALLDGKPLPGPEGKEVQVELGALIWVRTRDME